MTKVANSLISAEATITNKELKQQIVDKVFERYPGHTQSFQEVHMNGAGENEYMDDALLAGGSVFYETDVFAAAFNHVEPEIIADWFEQLPWREWDNASLTIHGNDFTVFVLVVDGECRRTVSDD